MYDADYDAYLAEKQRFEVRDSGKKAVYSDGNQRDDPGDKPRFDLLYPRGMEYEETLLYRVAMHYMRGGRKYGDRNWEKSSTEESLLAHETALHRHFVKFALGIEDGEDHAAAIVWNLQAILYTRWRISQRVEAVMPVHTEESVEAAIQRLEESPVFKTYVFPVKPENPRAEYFNQITVKAASLTDAVLEMEKMLGRETAEHSAELDRQQDEDYDQELTVAPMTPEQEALVAVLRGEKSFKPRQQKNVNADWQEKAAKIGGPCPDGGACHHGCTEQVDWPCYRVLTCGPLSGVMPSDRWPKEVLQHNHDKEASRLAAERELRSQ